jgi:hypothetical protein
MAMRNLGGKALALVAVGILAISLSGCNSSKKGGGYSQLLPADQHTSVNAYILRG